MRTHQFSGQFEPLDRNRTYTRDALRRCGVGPKIWSRLVQLGMPVDVVGNRVFQQGAVVCEWLAKLAEVDRVARAAR